MKTSENRNGFIRKASKTVHEWNGHPDFFSRPQVIEYSRQYLLLRTDILQKTVVECPCKVSAAQASLFIVQCCCKVQ